MELSHNVKISVLIGRWQCPFPHEPEKWPPCDNDFQGSGSTLGSALKAGTQTVKNRTATGSLDSEPMPKENPMMPDLYGQAKPIKLAGMASPNLPLTCAAHHLIPAQASLRGSDLVLYLYKGSAVFNKPGKKKGTITKGGGKLIENAGYDVNGAQNGVWLPGPYALRKKRGQKRATVPKVRTLRKRVRPAPVKLASDIQLIEDPEAEDLPVSGVGDAAEPDGARPVKGREVSYYLLYTISAMRKTVSQYHDAHGQYSKFVLDSLQRIAVELDKLAYKGACGECPERKPNDKLPPPYRLVTRLNGVSSKLRNYLVGSPSGWRKNVWTSQMAVEFGKKVNMDIQIVDIETPPPPPSSSI